MGIEPTSLAWEARVIPLYDARVVYLPPCVAEGRVRAVKNARGCILRPRTLEW